MKSFFERGSGNKKSTCSSPDHHMVCVIASCPAKTSFAVMLHPSGQGNIYDSYYRQGQPQPGYDSGSSQHHQYAHASAMMPGTFATVWRPFPQYQAPASYGNPVGALFLSGGYPSGGGGIVGPVPQQPTGPVGYGFEGPYRRTDRSSHQVSQGLGWVYLRMQ